MNKSLAALTLSLALMAGGTSFAFADETHSDSAVTEGIATAQVIDDTTATINYCFSGLCHIDFQDSDGVGRTYSTSQIGSYGVDGTITFGTCPVGTPGLFVGVWAHVRVGDTITSTDCDNNVSFWDLISETEIVRLSPSTEKTPA